MCDHVHVWFRRLAYMRSRGLIADKHAKLGCTAQPRALLPAKLSHSESCDHITLLHGEILADIEQEREEKTSETSINEEASCWVLRNTAH